MRKHLMETFDEIYILDLHGNSKKKEVSPDGSKDENVFDIQQGVSINLFIKNNTKKESELAHVFHDELHGTRKSKYEFLEKSSFMNRNWNKLDAVEPNHYFVPKDFRMEEEYNKGFKINNLLEIYSSGIETAKDSTVIKFTSEDVQKVVDDFNTKENKELVNLYNINENKVSQVTSDLKRGEYGITEILYRPFDIRNTVYTDKSQGVLWRPKNKIMRHAAKENYSLLLTKRVTSFPNYHHVFITDLISERCTISLQTGEVGNVFPLYLYENDEKIPNLNKEIWEEINNITGETKPEDILDYIYAVLHSESYREKYKEFLKIDFPCIPYPKNKDLFWKLVELGTKLREVHLLESVSKSDFQTTFSQSGTNIVEKKHPKYEDGNIHINEIQYFGNVSEVVWNFYIWGYQPAQKWLKDRKEIELSIDDIQHYQKIIVALTETDKTMKEINKLNIL